MIAVVDYGAGNLFSVANALREVGADFQVTADLEESDAVLLPGVGHFGQMMAALDERNLRPTILAAAHAGKPILGVCLGMQALFHSSEEAPGLTGLGLIEGQVHRFPETSRIPHMGWAEVCFSNGDREWFYFANSYYAPVVGATRGEAVHGIRFSAAVSRGNITGFQFHPEKSGVAGLKLLREWCDRAC